SFQRGAHWFSNLRALDAGGVCPKQAGQPAEVVFKVEGANVITALRIRGKLLRQTESDSAHIAVSTVNGLVWKEVWKSDRVGEQAIDLKLVNEVNGSYEVLVKISLAASTKAADVQLREIAFETTTMLNSKTQ